MRCTVQFILIAIAMLTVSSAFARKWNDNTGTFSVEAEYVKVEDGKVHLKRADNGAVVKVPIDRLSQLDRDHVDVLLRPVAGPKKPIADTEPAVGKQANARSQDPQTTTDELDKLFEPAAKPKEPVEDFETVFGKQPKAKAGGSESSSVPLAAASEVGGKPPDGKDSFLRTGDIALTCRASLW